MISKQVIIIRKDLNMRKGKMVAQGAHASLKAILDDMQKIPSFKGISLETFLYENTAIHDWINGSFTKICLSVDSEEELDDLYKKAKEANLKCAMIVDAGKTEFGGIPTKTCIAIGPNWDQHIDPITKHLKLL